MAIFKANNVLRLLIKSPVRQLIAINGFQRNCETFNNPFRPQRRYPFVSDEENQSKKDQEKDSDTSERRHGGFERRSDGFERRSDGLERRSDGFERRSDGFERRSDGFERRSDGFERRSDGFQGRFNGFDRQSDGFDNRSKGFQNRYDAYDGRSRGGGYRNQSDRYQSGSGFSSGYARTRPQFDNYYRTRNADLGKLRGGIGSESEWFKVLEDKVVLAEQLSGAKLVDQKASISCGQVEYKIWNKFSEIDNLDKRLAAVLQKMGHDDMSTIQKHSYDILNRKLLDILGSAETGSGKTLAFLVPILNNIVSTYPKKLMEELGSSGTQSPQLLVLAPTRELVQQISTEAQNLLQLTPLRVCSVIGGVNIGSQINDINLGCQVIVATPGRLIDLLQRQVISLAFCSNLVIDEGDRMLDMGFEPQIRSIVHESNLPKQSERLTSLFSATFPREIMSLSKELLKDNFGKIIVGNEAGSRDPSIPKSITQSFVLCNAMTMMDDLMKLLEGSTKKTILFCNLKADISVLHNKLRRLNIPVSMLHGDLTQRIRDSELESFKDNKTKILIATSVASRGLDVADVECIINYGAPAYIDDYIHRVGRCGRMGRSGTAITLTTRQQVQGIASDLTKVLQKCCQPVPEFLQSHATAAPSLSRRMSY